jgi:hypothetical protein
MGRVALVEASDEGFAVLWHLYDNYAARDAEGNVTKVRYEQADGRVSLTVARWLGYETASDVKYMLDCLARDELLIRQTDPLTGEEATKHTRLYALEFSPLALEWVPRVPRAIVARITAEYPIRSLRPEDTIDSLRTEIRRLKAELKDKEQTIEFHVRRNEELQRILDSRSQVVHRTETPTPNYEVDSLMRTAPQGTKVE